MANQNTIDHLLPRSLFDDIDAPTSNGNSINASLSRSSESWHTRRPSAVTSGAFPKDSWPTEYTPVYKKSQVSQFYVTPLSSSSERNRSISSGSSVSNGSLMFFSPDPMLEWSSSGDVPMKRPGTMPCEQSQRQYQWTMSDLAADLTPSKPNSCVMFPPSINLLNPQASEFNSSCTLDKQRRFEQRCSLSTDGSDSDLSSPFKTKKSDLYKTEMCRSFVETGICKYNHRCHFAHSKAELRPLTRHPKYKSEFCKSFAKTGSCSYGTRCCFQHEQRVVVKPVKIAPLSMKRSKSRLDSFLSLTSAQQQS